MYEYENSDLYELAHHGVKGQKWGIRRYQNKDGSLTDAGRKRQSIGKTIKDFQTKSKRKKALKKARETRAANREAAEKRQRDIEAGRLSYKKMTTKEINDRIERMNLEKKYQQLLEETNPPTKFKKAGKDFIAKMWKEAITPAMAEAGKQLLKDQLVKAGTKKSKEELNSEALSKLAKDWQNKANIARDKKNAWKNEYDLNNMKKEAEEKTAKENEEKDKASKEKNKQTQKAENYEVYDPNGKLIVKYGKNGKRKYF